MEHVMTEQDRRYYGYSEIELIKRAIEKHKRWIKANPDKTQDGLRRLGIMYRLSERLDQPF